MQGYCVADFINILGHKIFHRVFREKFFELAVELACKSFVVGYNQCGLIQGGDDVGHGEGLAGTCYPQQSLELVAFLEAFDQGLYGCGLVSGRLIF